MKKTLLVVMLGVLMVSILAACQGTVSGAPNISNLRQITASGTGKVYLVPDIAYIYIGVHTQANDVGSALNQNNAQAQAIASTLKELNVAAEDIQTSAFNVYPLQQYSPTGELTETMYAVDNTVYVTVRDLQNLGSILDAVVRSGANTINGITFDVQNRASAEAEARKLAIDNAKANAAELAQLAGVQLGDLFSVYVSTPTNPMPVYEAKGGVGASAAVPVAAGQLVVQVDANMTYLIK